MPTYNVLHGQTVLIDLTSNVSFVQAPLHGDMSYNDAMGKYNYVAYSDFTGEDSFTVRPNGALDSNVVTISVDVTDQAPVVTDIRNVTVLHGQSVAIDLAAHATDADGDTLNVTFVQAPSRGNLFLDDSIGKYIYTSVYDYSGPVSFTIKANDGALDSNIATVSINVTDRAPVVTNIVGVSVLAGQTVAIDLAAHASDADSDTLVVAFVQAPSHGNMYFDSTTGAYNYVAYNGYSGTDSFTFKANDGALDSNIATATIVVHGPPIASDASLSIGHDQVLTGIDLTQYVSDADGDPLTISVVSQPANGTLTQGSDGKYEYDPPAKWAGTDTFTIKGNDGVSDSNTATITIDVTNTAPVATDAALVVEHDQVLTGIDLMKYVSDADGDPLTISIVSPPANGQLTQNDDGTYIFTPDAAFIGTATFTIKANDGIADSNTATVTIHVTPTITLSLIASTDSTVTVGGTVSGGDVAGLTVAITGVAVGTTVTDASGNYSITLSSSQYGAIDATATDSSGQSTNTAEVVGTIGYNVAADQTFKASAEFGVLTDLVQSGNHLLTVLAIAVDGNTYTPGQPITLTSGSQLMIAGDGSFSYVPYLGFTGTDSAVVTSTLGTKIQITPVNFIVAAPATSESASTFGFTAVGNGSLTYISNAQNVGDSQNYQTFCTVGRVPFRRRLQNRCIDVGDLGGRLADVTLQSNLVFSDNTTATIRTRLLNFTFSGGQQLHTQVVHVRCNLKAALPDLQSFVDTGEDLDPLPTQVARWFAGQDYQSYMRYQTLTGVKGTFDGIVSLLDGGTTYYDDPNYAYYGYEGGPNNSDIADVSVGRQFWTGADAIPLDLERYGTIIHELSHASAPGRITDQGGYFNNPGALQNETNSVEWYEDADNSQLLASPPETNVLVITADAYAGYLTQYYYRWGPLS